MKIAFFDTKPYDKDAFDRVARQNNIKIKYHEDK